MSIDPSTLTGSATQSQTFAIFRAYKVDARTIPAQRSLTKREASDMLAAAAELRNVPTDDSVAAIVAAYRSDLLKRGATDKATAEAAPKGKATAKKAAAKPTNAPANVPMGRTGKPLKGAALVAWRKAHEAEATAAPTAPANDVQPHDPTEARLAALEANLAAILAAVKAGK